MEAELKSRQLMQPEILAGIHLDSARQVVTALNADGGLACTSDGKNTFLYEIVVSRLPF